MTDGQKLAKLEETEQKAWDNNWTKWSPSGWDGEDDDRATN